MSTELIFENPLQQYNLMEQRLRKELNDDVVDEIVAHVQIKSKEKYDQILEQFIRRVNQIEKIYETETESKSQYFERMQEFLAKTNPGILAEELKHVLTFTEIELEYKKLIKFFSKREFGKFFLRYQFDNNAFKALSVGLLSDIKNINSSLEEYAQVVTNHLAVMKSVKDATGGKTAFKVGTKIVGTLLGGPLGSIAGGALANALTNDDSKISNSYGNVIDAWSHYLNTVDDFLLKLKERYEHILLTLVGGLFLRVSQDIGKLHITISELSLLELGIDYRITKSGLVNYKKWMSDTLAGIQAKLNNEQYELALKATNDLFNYVNRQPLLKYEIFTEGKCYLYMACLYKYAAIATYAWSTKENNKAFPSTIYNLFKNMPILLKDEDIAQLNVPTQLDISISVVSQWIEEKTIEKNGVVFADLLLRSVERYKNVGYSPGEPLEDDLFLYFIISVGKFLCIDYKIKKYEFFLKETGVPTTALKELIKNYRAISSNNKDVFVSFMKNMIISRRIGLTLHIIKKPKVLTISFVLLLTLGGWLSKDEWVPVLQQKIHSIKEEQTEQPIIRKIEVLTSSANVRSSPDLNSIIVISISQGEEYEIITEQRDNENRIWYKVKVENQTGWISGKIVKVVEEN
jgi:hypothetical protein